MVLLGWLRRGGYDSYGAGGGRQADQQSFGAPRAGGGGFDSYNDRGPPGGSRGRGRGRADSGEFQSAGSFGSAAPDGPAAECEYPIEPNVREAGKHVVQHWLSHQLCVSANIQHTTDNL